jgi:glycosyltransferase involved in cell wall biosynthesis
MPKIVSLRPNILIVSSFWPGRDTGGVAEMGLVLAYNLVKQDNVTVLINDWEQRTPRETQEYGLNVIFYRLRSPWTVPRPIRNFVGWMVNCLRELRDIQKIIRDNKINIVQIRFPVPSFFVFRIIRLLGGPQYCVSFHGSDVHQFHTKDWPSRVLLKWLVAGASATSAVSRSLAKNAEDLFPCASPVRAIYNGKSVDDIIDKSNQPITWPHQINFESYLVNPANMTWVKGQDVLIRAWAKLPNDVSHFHLLIIGEARDAFEQCLQLIKELDCSDRVHLLGSLPQTELFSVMRKAKGCVMSSRHEGFSGTVLEAGALGLGLVCTNIPPFKEIVRHNETGLIVATEDPDSMAHAITTLARDTTLGRRLGEALQSDVRTQFSVEKMTEGYLTLYKEVLLSRH